jgi:uncharacterized NAD(P)/FAD-binding protein YdhS
MTRQIIIVGAGFSGATTAVRLARLAATHDLSITVIDKSPAFARGVAYQHDDEGWLLNALPGNMHALDDEPGTFAAFCQARGVGIDNNHFATRSLYGDYLEDLLAQAMTAHPSRLRCLRDKVECIESNGNRTRLALAEGGTLMADHLVLATGLVARVRFGPLDFHALQDRYVDNPWELDRLREAPEGSTFCIIGTGLTAMDVLSSLRRRMPSAHFHLVSRHGLLPQPHRFFDPDAVPVPVAALQTLPGLGSARACAAKLRGIASAHQEQGGDWRQIMDALRPLAPVIWSGWPMHDKARFVEHLSAYWDAHRHRCPPETLRMLHSLQDEGRLSVSAARITQARRDADGIDIRIRRRHAREFETLRADYLVNCARSTGFITEDALFSQLMEQGLASHDTMGLRVDETYRLIGADSRPVPHISYVGPLLKGKFWEATAVPELRRHVSGLTEALCTMLRS